MPHNDKKVVAVILEQSQALPQRCEGYRDEVLQTVSDILGSEQTHKVQATNIQQKVTDKCQALGNYLAVKRRGRGSRKEA